MQGNEATLVLPRLRLNTGPRVLSGLSEGALVLAIFIATQILDGLFTYWGVLRFGLGIEMNVWLAATMESIGPATALVAAKTFACGCGVLLYSTEYLRPLAVAAGLYIGVALVPWVLIITVLS